MNLILTVLEITAPVFLLGTAGFCWRKAGYDYPVEFVTRLAMTLAVPCLIFVALMQTEIELGALSSAFWAILLAHVIVGALAAAAIFFSGIDRRAYLAPIILSNTGNLGLPLALFAFGEAGFGFAVVAFVVTAVLSFTLGIWLVAPQISLGRLAREPVLWAALLGTVFLWQGWQTPLWLTRALELAGNMAIPLMLFTLGVAVSRLNPGALGRAFWLSLLKLALGLMAGVFSAWVFGLGPVASGVLIVQMATPVAVTSYLLAERYDAEPQAVAGLVMISTLLSILALPVVLGFVI